MDTRYPGNEDGFQYLVMDGNKNPGNKAYLVTSADFQGNTHLMLRRKSLTITTLFSNPKNSSQKNETKHNINLLNESCILRGFFNIMKQIYH